MIDEKTYISATTKRTPRPRSKRLREAGVGMAGTSSTVVLNGSGGGTTIVSGSSHTHSNLNILEQFNTDTAGYLWLDRIREVLQDGDVVSEEVLEKIKAGYADKAHDLDADSPVLSKFLSRTDNDTAQGHIGFLQGLTSHQLARLLQGVELGNFSEGLYAGTGAKIDSQGNAEVQSLKVRTSAEFMELIVNRQTAVEGDEILSESDIIEEVTALGNGRFGLKLQTRYEGYFTAFTEGAVVRGTVNNIYGSTVGTPLKYYTSWMRVNMVNTVTNYMEVTTYPHAEVPGGQNFIPTELMRINRWGHQTDESRQTFIVLSTTERRIIFYQRVTKPIIDPKVNIGMCLGKAPDFLKGGNQIDDNQNYLYVKGVFTEGVQNVDVYGEPVYEHTIEGPWESGRTYYYKDYNPDRGRYEINSVYHKGCQWQCMQTGTTEEPSFTSTHWVMTVGDSAFKARFVEPEKTHRLKDFRTTLTLQCLLGWTDITDDVPDQNISWTRYTEGSDGVQRTASDAIWASRRGGSGKQITLTREDLDIHSGGVPSKIIFTATAQLTETISAVANYTYGQNT